MAIGVGAGGFVGIAVETVAGTYTPPAIYMPLRGESVKWQQSPIERRPLRGIADLSGMLPGDSHVAGDLNVEITHDTLPYLLRAARCTIVKTGSSAPYTYTITPNANAVPAQTLSITVVEAGVVFGYTGCVISSQKYSIDGGLLVGSFAMIGRDEASQTLPTPTYILTTPAATGQFRLEIPTATQVFDADAFDLTIDDKAEPQFRLQDTGTAARFVKYGERSVELSVTRDFDGRVDYDAYKALTAQGVTLKAIKNATNDEVDFLVPAGIKSSYDITGLSGQADLIRAAVKYTGAYDAVTSAAYQIVVKSTSSITIP